MLMIRVGVVQAPGLRVSNIKAITNSWVAHYRKPQPQKIDTDKEEQGLTKLPPAPANSKKLSGSILV